MSCAAYIAASGPAEGACLAREHAGEVPRAAKLIDVVRDALRARHYSRRTEKAYIGWIRRYILFHGKRHPRELGAAEATRFLTALAVDAKVSGSTQNQALAALLFLYREVVRVELPWLDELVRARRPRRLPVVLSRDEVCAVIAHLAGTPKLRDVTTTMIYTHVLNRGPGAVRSPADVLAKGSGDQPWIAIDDVRSR